MNCKRCSREFKPIRVVQVYCSARCRDASKKRRKRSGDRTHSPISIARSGDMAATPQPEVFSDGSRVSGLSGMSGTAQLREHFNVTTTHSNIARTATRSSRHVLIGGLSPWPRQHDDIRYITWQCAPEYSIKGDFMSREIWMSC